MVEDVGSVCREDSHIDQRCPVVVGHLNGDGVEIIGADDAVAPVDEEKSEKGDDEGQHPTEGLDTDPTLLRR